MQQRFRYYFLFITLILCGPLLAQQSINVTAEKNVITLGEPVTLSIRITGDQAYEAAIGDSLGRFEVLEKRPVDIQARSGSVITIQQLVVTCFDSGQFRIPPVPISGYEAILSPGFDIMVNPLPADSTKEYGDIKQIVSLHAPDQLPYLAALAAITFLSVFMIWRMIKKREIIPAFSAPAAKEIPVQWLMQQLIKLKEQWIKQETGPKEMGNELMDIFRTYLAGLGIYSKSKTGEELIVTTKTKFDADKWMGIAQTIRLCNAMRFGKYNALVDEGLIGIEAFEKVIQPTTAPYPPKGEMEKIEVR